MNSDKAKKDHHPLCSMSASSSYSSSITTKNSCGRREEKENENKNAQFNQPPPFHSYEEEVSITSKIGHTPLAKNIASGSSGSNTNNSIDDVSMREEEENENFGKSVTSSKFLRSDKQHFPYEARKMIDYLDKHDPQVAQWTKSGDGFIIKDKNRLSTHYMSLFFSTNDFQSFRRQLNYYGFKTFMTLGREGLFCHHRDGFFIRGRYDLMKNMKASPKKKHVREKEGRKEERSLKVRELIKHLKDDNDKLKEKCNNLSHKVEIMEKFMSQSFGHHPHHLEKEEIFNKDEDSEKKLSSTVTLQKQEGKCCFKDKKKDNLLNYEFLINHVSPSCCWDSVDFDNLSTFLTPLYPKIFNHNEEEDGK